MAIYSILGLLLECSRPLPHLVAEAIEVSAVETSATLRVELGEAPSELAAEAGWIPFFVSPLTDSSGEPLLEIKRLPKVDAFQLHFADGTDFWIDGERRHLWVQWQEPHTLEDATTYLLGPVLGFLLRLRGVVSLHASAVVIDGRSVALAGPSGVGKSTAAAAFARLGFPILSDDITTLEPSESDFLVQSDCPRLRLWPESSEMMYGSPEALPRLSETWEKRFLDLEQHGYQVARHPHSLAAVYLLAGEPSSPEAPTVVELSERQALIALVANSYANLSPDAPMRAHEFDLLVRLVHRFPVRRIHRPETGLDPTRLCEFIVADFRRRRSASEKLAVTS